MSKPGVGENLSRVQSLVDELSQQLGRSVVVDNAALEFLCASAQIGAIDHKRVAAIIDRAPPPDPVPWILSHGIETARQPVRLPDNEEHGMLARVCFPIRQEGALAGYLWLFDEPPVTAEEGEATSRTVRQLAPLIGTEDAALRDRADEVRRLAGAALVRATSESAVEEARARALLPEDGELVVHVAELHPQPAATCFTTDPQLELARSPIGRPHLARCDAHRLTAIARHTCPREAEALENHLRQRLRNAGYRVQVIGRAAAAAPLAVESTAARAGFAAAVAELLGRERALDWSELGSWRLLHGWPLEPATVRELSEDAARLLDRGTREQQRTALAYLDHGRSAVPTCRALAVHRSTLYYRLERIRDLLGGGVLEDGWRAASLHVALKLHDALHVRGRE
ncbi:helix-turn-helix domain-containing protein [Salinifilum aidingensis]